MSSNKMALDLIPESFNFLENLFKKIAIFHGKVEFSKIKGKICNVLIEAAISNGLIVVKLKLDLKYRAHLYFEPVHLHIIYQALAFLKFHNEFYEDISIAKDLSREEMFRFSDIAEIQEQNESVTEKTFRLGRK